MATNPPSPTEGGMAERIQRKRTKYSSERSRAWRASTTRPRAKCHPEKPHRARGLCETCYGRWLYSSSQTHRAQRRASAENWGSRHPERKKRSNSAARIKRRYGLTTEQVEAMRATQDGACAICEAKPERLSIDHCHETGRVRGLLCAPCNRALGFFERFQKSSEAKWIATALRYLEGKCP